MFAASEAQRPRGSCVSCMGTGACWVCDGRGRYETEPGVWQRCVTCAGSGACPACASVDARATLGVPPKLTLPQQTTPAGPRA